MEIGPAAVRAASLLLLAVVAAALPQITVPVPAIQALPAFGLPLSSGIAPVMLAYPGPGGGYPVGPGYPPPYASAYPYYHHHHHGTPLPYGWHGFHSGFGHHHGYHHHHLHAYHPHSMHHPYH